MTTLEGHEAIFQRGIRLLNSNAEGSEEKLRSLLEEVIKQKYGSSRTLNLRKEPGVKKESGSKSSSSIIKKESSKKFEKRHDSKTLEERPDGSRDGSSSRKSLEHKSSHYKSGSSPSSPRSSSVGLSQSVSMSLLRDLDSGKSDSIRGDDDDDLALEILEEDLACVICRGMDVGVRNQLVECLECHSLYHQECHQPPVPDNMNEPRSAWYCASCIKAMNKAASSGSMSGNRLPTVNMPSSPSLKAQQHQSSKTSSGSSSKVFGGFPLPIKSHGSSKSSSSTSKSSSSSSNSNSSKVIVQKINMVSADKRLAIMKKKAAKLQEKRKLTK